MIKREYTIIHCFSGMRIFGWNYVGSIEEEARIENITDLRTDTEPDIYTFQRKGARVEFFPSFEEGYLVVETEEEAQQERAVSDLIPLLFGSGVEATPA
ncbi:hypothetical protein CMI48_03610 [Candidatus Pacearchaeota archaeon]|jgi:hypothetical protein|nr:hypothetical protein [Candidatus Pacearchaeota archaeon]|tara:strand:- start:310 stop:606 length:297 start_codon:yes stop_codon:yes gene_type:complete